MPDPSVEIQAWWLLARDCPREWKQLIARYHQQHDDVITVPAKQSAAKPAVDVGVSDEPDNNVSQLGWKCATCGKVHATYKQMAAHARSAHGRMSDFRSKIGDTSICPICQTEFYTRSRLIIHLSERRTRCRARGEPCQVALMRLQLPDVESELLKKLEAQDADTRRAYRRGGHRNVLSECPAAATRARPYAKRASAIVPPPPEAPLASRPPSNRRRLNGKQPPPPQYQHNG